MSGKWEKFHNEKFDASPSVDITQPGQGESSALGDWRRQLTDEKENINVFVNGRPMADFYNDTRYNNFATIPDLKNFFREEILKEVLLPPPDAARKKEEMVEYLAQNFHQGGHLLPFASSIALFLATNKKVGVDDHGNRCTINLHSTPTGFILDDHSKLTSFIDHELVNEGSIEPFVKPPEGFDYVVKAQGTLDFNFMKNPSKPSITVENCGISYANDVVKNELDKRSFIRIFIDYLKKTFNLDDVKVLGPPPQQNSDVIEEDLENNEGKEGINLPY